MPLQLYSKRDVDDAADDEEADNVNEDGFKTVNIMSDVLDGFMSSAGRTSIVAAPSPDFARLEKESEYMRQPSIG